MELPGNKVSSSKMQHQPATKLIGKKDAISSGDHGATFSEFISCKKSWTTQMGNGIFGNSLTSNSLTRPLAPGLL